MPLYPTFKQEKLQSEVVNMLKKKKKFYPIAPDGQFFFDDFDR